MRDWINLLCEEWVTSHDTRFGTNEIFRNPSQRELAKLISDSEYGIIKGIIVPKDGTVYIFSNEEVEHRDAEAAIGTEGIRLFFSKSHGLEFEGDDFDVWGGMFDLEDDDWGEDRVIKRIKWLNNQPNIIRALGKEIPIEEARSNPDKNIRISPLEELKQIRAEHGPDLFVSFTQTFKTKKQRAPSGIKLGINPSSQFHTPMGVYCYPIDYVIDFTEEEIAAGEMGLIDNHLHTGGLNAPFTGYGAWQKAFVFRATGKFLDSTFDETDYKNAISALKDFLGLSDLRDLESTSKLPYERLWNTTRKLALYTHEQRKGKLSNKNKNDYIGFWNTLFRKLGFTHAIDWGEGYIYDNEPTQAVIFDPSSIKVITVINRSEGEERMFYSMKDRILHDPRLLEKLPADTISRLPFPIMKVAIEDYVETKGSIAHAAELLCQHEYSERLIAHFLNTRTRDLRLTAIAAYDICRAGSLVAQFDNKALIDLVTHTSYKIDRALGLRIAKKEPLLLTKLVQTPERVDDWSVIAKELTGQKGNIRDVISFLYPS